LVKVDALPESRQNGLSSARLRANLLRKKAMAMRELAEYSQAAPLFDQALTIQKQIAAADPKDTRSLFDVYVDLTQAAENFEAAVYPAFATDPQIRHRYLALAAPLLKEAESIQIQLLKENPSNDEWKAELASVEVRLGAAEQNLNASGDSAAFSAATETGRLVFLGQAYRSAGQIERARAAANEGLALLPALEAGAPMTRTRKLLQLEADAIRTSR
jgi:tetratricopeptide (TPR) repeat protein